MKMKIDGMTCEVCTAKVSAALESLKGVSGINVDLKRGTASVSYDEGLISETDIISAIIDTGFIAKIKHGIF